MKKFMKQINSVVRGVTRKSISEMRTELKKIESDIDAVIENFDIENWKKLWHKKSILQHKINAALQYQNPRKSSSMEERTIPRLV